MLNDFVYEQENRELDKISESIQDSSGDKSIIENTLKFEDLTIKLGDLQNHSKSSSGSSGDKKAKKDSQAYASSKDSKKKEMLGGDVDLCQNDMEQTLDENHESDEIDEKNHNDMSDLRQSRAKSTPG